MANRFLVFTLGLMALPQGAALTPSSAPPQTRVPTALVVGQVVDAATNRPIAGATVAISSTPARRVLTDDQGRFLFRDLAKGTYVFSATASGYLDGGYGQGRPGGTTQPFSLEEDQRVGDLAIRLWKHARLAGTVTDEIGNPVIGVSVSIGRRESIEGRAPANVANVAQEDAAYTARTDDRGAYEAAGLPPGTYVISVPTRTTAVPIGLVDANGAVTESLRSSGSTAMSMGMSAMSPGVRLGDFVVQTSNQGNFGSTNALIGRLPVVTLPDGRIQAYPTTFFPSVTSAADATAITLRSGDERSGVDLQLRPVVMARVSGTLVGPGGPQSNFAVHLLPAYAAGRPLERTHEAAVTAADANGAFTFLAVPPGQYVLKAWRLPQLLVIGTDVMPPDTTLWGEVPVSVGDAAVTGVVLNLRPGVIVSGRVEFAGATPAPRATTTQTMLSVCFEPAWPLALGARFGIRVAADGSFMTQGVPPGQYFPKLPNQFSPPGWFLDAVTQNGQDLMTSPLTVESQPVGGVVITLTDRRTDLSGTIQDASGKPDAGASVLVFPADYRPWIQHGMFALAARLVPASQAGTYSATGLRPGDYLVAAAREEFLADWQQASKIEALVPMATKVTLARGDNKRQDLKTIR